MTNSGTSESVLVSKLVPRPKRQKIRAERLKPNDRVGLVCPASRPFQLSTLERVKAVLEELALVPVLGKHILDVNGFMAGTDKDRAQDFNDFLHDQSIRAIMCVTGGYGSLHLLPTIDYVAIREKPKIILGGEDNSHLLLTVQQETGLSVFSGPNLDRITDKRGLENLRRAVMAPEEAVRFEPHRFADSDLKPFLSIVSGKVSGTLMGGNLTALVSLMGTPYEIDLADTILCLDDVGERYDILDRWFTTLWVSGQLERTRAVACGVFENCGVKGSNTLLSIEDFYSDRLKEMQKPSCFGINFGQSEGCPYLPLGVEAEIDTGKGFIQLKESPLA